MLKEDCSKESNMFGLPAHYRPRQGSALWRSPLHNWEERLVEAIERAPARTSKVFFRADDVGAGSRAFEALCRLFQHHNVPLAMSVVPAWLSLARQRQLFECAPLEEPLWGWHQHGWRHVNWQRSGKKAEFGDHRPFEKQWRDIWQGRQKMLSVFQEHFIPVFTPPWNRLSAYTIKILQQLDFRAVSVTKPLPKGQNAGVGLKNLRVQVDLHTRKGKDRELDFQSLLEELMTALGRKEPSGIVIHHQRMTPFAFRFLDKLLHLLEDHRQVAFLSLREMFEEEDE